MQADPRFPPYKPARVTDLVPYARNARTHTDAQVAQIAASIREFGFTNPVLVNNSSMIIAGHGRVAAAKLLGISQVPTICLNNLTEDETRHLRHEIDVWLASRQRTRGFRYWRALVHRSAGWINTHRHNP